MSLTDLPGARLAPTGVQFRYLVLQLRVHGEEKTVLRGVNYRPYIGDPDDLILEALRQELQEIGLSANGDAISVAGGGGLSRNPYYETIEIYGQNVQFGVEESRDVAVQLLREAYPDHKVSAYSPDHFAIREREEKEKKAAAKAKVAAAKAAKAKAEAEKKAAEEAAAEAESSAPEANVQDQTPEKEAEDGG